MKKEIFKDVKGFENEYKISNFGRVLGEGWALVVQNFKISTDVKYKY